MLDWLVYEKGLIAMPHCLCLYTIGHDQLASLSDDFFPRPVYNDTLLRIVKKIFWTQKVCNFMTLK